MDSINGNSLSERHLVEKVLGGDTQAFAVLVRSSEKLVAHIVCKMISNREDQQDIAQDTYYKAFRNLATFQFQSQFSTWVCQIAYNTCLNFLKKKAVVVYPDLNNLPEISNGDITMTTDDAALPLYRKERIAVIQRATEQLPPVYQLLLGLFHQEEFSCQKISSITGLPEGTVKSYLFRARKMLREALIQHYKQDAL